MSSVTTAVGNKVRILSSHHRHGPTPPEGGKHLLVICVWVEWTNAGVAEKPTGAKYISRTSVLLEYVNVNMGKRVMKAPVFKKQGRYMKARIVSKKSERIPSHPEVEGQ
ncbi:hypothetical protein AVEN_264413-1 [Araneus ventricosus]|uniref:Uncharacterized protein n=1 Tax=Araneus ventricosus TaxID=182803 RepID=A0A4Y2UPC6_ARAVE|nr:hypothetical protein AVEN_264413-1 [Araneus ventricosus]